MYTEFHSRKAAGWLQVHFWQFCLSVARVVQTPCRGGPEALYIALYTLDSSTHVQIQSNTDTSYQQAQALFNTRALAAKTASCIMTHMQCLRAAGRAHALQAAHRRRGRHAHCVPHAATAALLRATAMACKGGRGCGSGGGTSGGGCAGGAVGAGRYVLSVI